MDFFTTTWITEVTTTEQTITRIVDNYKFTIIYDGNTVTINNFPVTKKEWQKIPDDGEVTLKDGPKTVTVTSDKTNVNFGNNPLYGTSTSVSIRYGPTSKTPTSTKPDPRGTFT